jgi:hypothetical protein
VHGGHQNRFSWQGEGVRHGLWRFFSQRTLTDTRDGTVWVAGAQLWRGDGHFQGIVHSFAKGDSEPSSKVLVLSRGGKSVCWAVCCLF